MNTEKLEPTVTIPLHVAEEIVNNLNRQKQLIARLKERLDRYDAAMKLLEMNLPASNDGFIHPDNIGMFERQVSDAREAHIANIQKINKGEEENNQG